MGFMIPTSAGLMQRRCEGHLARGGGEKTEMPFAEAAWSCISHPPPEPRPYQDFIALHSHIPPSSPLSSSARASALPGTPQLQSPSRCSPRPFHSLPTKPLGGSSISLTNLGLNRSNFCLPPPGMRSCTMTPLPLTPPGPCKDSSYPFSPLATAESWILGTANPKNNNSWKNCHHHKTSAVPWCSPLTLLFPMQAST